MLGLFILFRINSNNMDEDRLDQQEEKNFGRRSRKDQQGRDYVCGCGKSYLSYPALYTHIKTKHDGQKPEGTLKVTASSAVRKQPSNTSQQNAGQPSINSSTKLAANQIPQAEIAPPVKQSSKLNRYVLNYIEQLTSLTDFGTLPVLLQMSPLCKGYTCPDNRIIQQKVGEALFQKYLQLIQINIENDPVGNVKLGCIQKICGKSQVELVMIAYLIGVGRFVGSAVMDIYMTFCRLFRDCYADHAPEIYEICFKHKQQNSHEPHRDDPYKNYQYSYLPSSSKSKSYLALNSTQTPHQTYVPNILINTRQSKYLPIIVDFFVRVYLPAFQTRQVIRQVYVYIAADFCAWVYRAKISNIEVGFVAKPEFKGKQQFKSIIQAQTNIAQSTQQKKQKTSPTKQKQKRKQRQKQKQKSRTKKPQQNQSHPAISAQQSSQQEDEVDKLQNNEDEDSYKIGHQIAQQLGGRDRSGSIHHYVNGHQIIQHGGEEGDVDDNVGVADGNGHNMGDEEIQQYINT